MADLHGRHALAIACLIFGLVARVVRADDKPGAVAEAPWDDAADDEPLAPSFSAEQTARYLDETATHWSRTRRCAACHTIPPFAMARPLLPVPGPAAAEVRGFLERIVVDKLEAEPNLPPDGISAILVQVATALAVNDRLTAGKLHPVTRQALDRMWKRQRDDGSWEWPFRDVPPIKIDEHYGVTFAAIGAGSAPEGYADSELARAGLTKIRAYLRAHPAASLHQKGMVVWASVVVGDLLTADERNAFVRALLAVQRPDGGWSLASLVESGPVDGNVPELLRELKAKPGYGTEYVTFVGRNGSYTSSLASDGYATGFVIHVARQAGVPADNPQIVRGIAWLKRTQRESGRWFTPSQGNHGRNYIANTGTAYAIMALSACGAIEN